MVQMARRLYPYDEVSDDVYAQVIDDVLTASVNDEVFIERLRSIEQALNLQHSSNFFDLDADAQIKSMRKIEQTHVFTAFHAAVKRRLYNHPAIWALLGYEGPSFQHGGYLNRGAGEIDWLPEGE